MTDHFAIINDAVDVDRATEEATEYFLQADEMCMVSRYSWHHDIDEDSVNLEDQDTAEDFRVFVSDYASEKVGEAISELCWSIKPDDDDRIQIWRSITVPHDWLENGLDARPIGRYWAYVEDAAEPHWGDFSEGRRVIVLHGLVDMCDVDWQTTVTVNAHSEEEREIRVKDTASIHVLSATWMPSHRGDSSDTIAIGRDLHAGSSGFEDTLAAAAGMAA